MGQNDKQEVVFNHYQQHIGSHIPKECLLNFSELDWQHKDLQHLEVPFTKDEVKKVVLQAPKEKAPALMALLVYFSQNVGGLSKMAS
jgi:hypothetical protein